MEKQPTKEYTSSLTLTGNIAPSTITIDAEKGIAKYSIAVSQGLDKDGQKKDPLWFNCTSFKKEDNKLFETLQAIKAEGKGKQVTAKGFVTQNTVDKDGEKKYYTNFTIASVVPTKDFIKPAVNFAVSGQVFKALEEHSKTSINPDGKEVKKEYATVTMSLDKKDGKEYHSFVTTNKDHIAELKNLKKGDNLTLKGAHISPSGKMSLNKYSQVNNKELPSKEQSKEQSLAR